MGAKGERRSTATTAIGVLSRVPGSAGLRCLFQSRGRALHGRQLAAPGQHPRREFRRAAVLALGCLADYESNPTLGAALLDEDRTVRILAENSIRQVWTRAANEKDRRNSTRSSASTPRGSSTRSCARPAT